MNCEERDITLCKPLFFYLILTVICVFGRNTISFLGIPSNIFMLTRYGITAFFVLKAMKCLTKKKFLALLGLEFFFMISYAVSYFSGYLIGESITLYTISTLLVCIPVCVYTLDMSDIHVLYQYLLKAANINSIFMLLYMFTYSYHETGSYDMSGAYQLLFCFTIHFNELFKDKQLKKKIVLLVLVVLEMFFIIVRGSRGPLLCVAVYILLYMFEYIRRSTAAMGLTIVLIVAFTLFYRNMNGVLVAFSSYLASKNLNSRTITQMINQTMFSDSGRGALLESAKTYINSRWFLGYGAGSDSVLVGGYVHSMFYELMFDFGVPFGFLIFTLITASVLYLSLKISSPKRECAIVFIVTGYVMLFMSGTYLQNVYLFAFIGIVFNKRFNYSATLEEI